MPTGTTATSSSSSSPLVGNLSQLLGAKATVTNAQQAADKANPTQLGKDSFLQLLTTQLKNQDPNKPMDDTQFVSQMAQFSSLEQMQNLNQTMTKQAQFQSLAEASGMIGKYVSLLDPTTNATVMGQVQQVNSASGTNAVVINGQAYDANAILQVSATPITPTAPSASGSGTTSGSATTAGTPTTSGSATTSSSASNANSTTSAVPTSGAGAWIGI